MKSESLEQVSRPAIISKSVEVGQNFVTQPVSRWTTVEITTMCREDTAMRDDPAADAESALGDNTISGPIHDARITLQYGRYGFEIQINFFSEEGSKSWVAIRLAYTDTLRKFRQDAMSPCTQKPSPCRTQILARANGRGNDACNQIYPSCTVLGRRVPPPHLTG